VEIFVFYVEKSEIFYSNVETPGLDLILGDGQLGFHNKVMILKSILRHI
jgi:hypothetical protein